MKKTDWKEVKKRTALWNANAKIVVEVGNKILKDIEKNKNDPKNNYLP